MGDSRSGIICADYPNVLYWRNIHICHMLHRRREAIGYRNRKLHLKNRPIPFCAVHFDGSSEKMRVFLAKMQAYARAAFHGFVGPGGLEKSVEYMRQVICMNAGSGIRHCEQKPVILYLHFYRDVSLWRGKFESVGEKVVENLSAFGLVDPDDQSICGIDGIGEIDLFVLGQRLELCQVGLEKRLNFGRCFIQFHITGLQFSQVQYFTDQLFQLLAALAGDAQ